MAVRKIVSEAGRRPKKVHYIKSVHRGRETIWEGTLDYLIDRVFGYTLEVGHSWDSKIPKIPKSVNSLVNALNNSCTVSGRYSDYYSISSKEEFDKSEKKQPMKEESVRSLDDPRKWDDDKELTYKEAQRLARAYYAKGGDSFYETWEEYQFDDYVKEFGPMTVKWMKSLFRMYDEVDRDMRGSGQYQESFQSPVDAAQYYYETDLSDDEISRELRFNGHDDEFVKNVFSHMDGMSDESDFNESLVESEEVGSSAAKEFVVTMTVRMEKYNNDEPAEFDFTTDTNDVGEVVLTPADLNTHFVKVEVQKK